MATYDQFRTAPTAQSGFSFDVFARIQAWLDRRSTARALSNLSNQQLEDLGLIRADIADIARGMRPAHRIY